MRDLDPTREQQFFDIFADYFDLERTSGQKYATSAYSLDRMLPIAEIAGNPERRLRIAHIAGTKGKGSTALFLTALLASAGERCGTFTSPHLTTVRERFRVNGELVSYDVLIEHASVLESSLRQAGLRPTLFEIMTVLAEQMFVAEDCEFAVLETGLGGLLDATNYVPEPECCIITPISFDHTALLGNTIAEIAEQKAGIIKPQVPVILSQQPFAEAAATVERRAAEQDAPLLRSSALPPQWDLPGLPGMQRTNLATALAACHELGVSPQTDTFQFPELRGRCETIRNNPPVVIDAAHNADSAQKLVAALRELYPGTTFTVVLAVVKGKDAAGVFAALKEIAADFVLTHPALMHKGSQLDTLVELAENAGVRFRTVPELENASQLPENHPLLFTGSFFSALLGEKLFG